MNSKNIKLYRRSIHVLKMKKMQRYSNYRAKSVPTMKLHGTKYTSKVRRPGILKLLKAELLGESRSLTVETKQPLCFELWLQRKVGRKQ